ncbi:MAG: zf-TFIIB domain-containing protein [Parasphingorhabdus sp.]|jgi:uncharacterized protein|uniref:TFIIB-type zinc ribbon-containing protein n=1 Tax=Parasphingorhabdus sp. TaxID=2709688 RepID=UPI0026CE5CF3|tara:strand:- start:259 stop:552 length:294 start_codon:yes stop_codon:yes gene_type:complete
MNSSTATGKGMLCPICQVTLSISDRQGVEIDFCPQCRGVWLDRGELDKIIERSEAVTVSRPRDEGRSSPGFSAHDDRQRSKHHGYKRRRSFLSDLFD